jgi:hypothetical protein
MQILSQEILLQAVEFQPLASILSIYQDFSLNFVVISRYSLVSFGKLSTKGTMALPQRMRP